MENWNGIVGRQMKQKHVLIVEKEELYGFAIEALKDIIPEKHGYFWDNNGNLEIEWYDDERPAENST
jgi:hypothetical protein